MQVKRLWLCVVVCALGACSVPGVRPDNQWNAYRAQVEHDEKSGALSASQAQRRLWDGWVNIFGQDPTMTGYFAYSETLLRSAEEGRLPLPEARELVAAREQAAWKEYQAIQRRRAEVAGPDYDRW